MSRKHLSRRDFVKVAASIAGLAVLGAQCGPPAPTATPAPTPTARVVEVTQVVTPTPKPLPKGAAKVVPFLTNETDPVSVDTLRKIIAEFEKANPGVQIDLVLTGHGMEVERVVTAHAVGADLGIVQVRYDAIQDFAAAGYLLPLDDVVDSIGRDDFKPGTMGIVGGKVYAVAYAGGTHATLWVRTDLFKQAGLAYPKTYAELLAAAKALTKDTDGDGKIDVYGIGLPLGSDGATTARFINFVYQNGGDYFNKDGTIAFDRPGVLEAAKRYIELTKYSPPGITAWSWFDGLDAYLAGKIAMHPYGGRLGVNADRQAPKIRENSTVIWFPLGEKTKAGRGAYDYMGISSNCKYPTEAKAFLKYFLTGDRLARFEMTVPGHLIPPLKSVATLFTTLDNPYVKKYANDVKTLFDAADNSSEPAIQMGAVEPDGKWNPVFNPMPWSSALFARKPPIDAEMLQRIGVKGESPEAAWKWAIEEMKKAADDWKAKNPGWKPLVTK